MAQSTGATAGERATDSRPHRGWRVRGGKGSEMRLVVSSFRGPPATGGWCDRARRGYRSRARSQHHRTPRRGQTPLLAEALGAASC